MSYVVLARKYRPKNFSELIGQEFIVRALTNALTHNRLHHAYLLTGTRGVGKTTLGRILAKCLNCHAGISATPCGTCASCQEIDMGRALDLIEIDAASNTKVEDTRELLENVQYAPSRDRYKIYLIDEVHMLSNHSFNALLKTLEEPPEHVKFILATTDPQKLPITILSRCLQFSLRVMSVSQISAHLTDIIQRENFTAEPEALIHIAHAADGSMRDALSLMDQAISFGNGDLTQKNVELMLGITDSKDIFALIQALHTQDTEKLFSVVNKLADYGVDYHQCLGALITGLHQIALAQTFPAAITDDISDKAFILNLAQQLAAEDVQLYYQIALIGRRDLPLAPAPRAGFEMVLLRMLTFNRVTPVAATPANDLPKNIPPAIKPSTPKSSAPSMAPPKAKAPDNDAAPVAKLSAPANAVSPAITSADNQWEQLIERANLNGLTKLLATHCALKSISENEIILEIDPSHAAMASPVQQQKLQEALQQCLPTATKLRIEKITATSNTPAIKQQQAQQQKQQDALENINNDPNFQNLMSQFGAILQPESIITTK